MQWRVFIVERDLPNYSKQQYETRFTFSVCPNPKNVEEAPGFEIICGFCSVLVIFLWKAVLLAQPYPTNIIKTLQNPQIISKPGNTAFHKKKADLESRNFRFLLFILVPTAFHCLLLIDPHETRLIKSLIVSFLQWLGCKTPSSRQDLDSHPQHPLRSAININLNCKLITSLP